MFTCKGCTEVKGLVKEVEGLKQLVGRNDGDGYRTAIGR